MRKIQQQQAYSPSGMAAIIHRASYSDFLNRDFDSGEWLRIQIAADELQELSTFLQVACNMEKSREAKHTINSIDKELNKISHLYRHEGFGK